MRVHICKRNPECVADGSPNRLYVNGSLGSLIVGLDWNSGVQAWLPFKGYTDWWWPIAFHPARKEPPCES